jgi:glutathione S-transferase
MFLAEKGVSLKLVSIDLAEGEQHGDVYRTINPRWVVPTLVLEDGTAIGEVLAIWRYLEEAYTATRLLGATRKDKALVTMWERRVELEGFGAAMEGVRNAAPGQKDRAIAGSHDYEQIPALVDPSRLRVANFLSDLDTRLAGAPFVAGDRFSVADITALATIDFAVKAFATSIPEEHRADSLVRGGFRSARRKCVGRIGRKPRERRAILWRRKSLRFARSSWRSGGDSNLRPPSAGTARLSGAADHTPALPVRRTPRRS